MGTVRDCLKIDLMDELVRERDWLSTHFFTPPDACHSLGSIKWRNLIQVFNMDDRDPTP